MAWRPSPGEETRKEVQDSHSALGRSVCQGCEPQFFESPDSGEEQFVRFLHHSGLRLHGNAIYKLGY